MSNEVKTQGNKEVAVIYDVDGEQIKLTPKIVQEYIVGTDAQITMPEFKMFTSLCKARKLNPFLKEAYCIKYHKQLRYNTVEEISNIPEEIKKVEETEQPQVEEVKVEESQISMDIFDNLLKQV